MLAEWPLSGRFLSALPFEPGGGQEPAPADERRAGAASSRLDGLTRSILLSMRPNSSVSGAGSPAPGVFAG